jgi:Ribonuclease G/E
MDAAFADIGLGRNAFLSVSDIVAERRGLSPHFFECDMRGGRFEINKINGILWWAYSVYLQTRYPSAFT